MAEKVKRLGLLPLVHDPGQAWTYGLSSDVTGRLIEVVSGQSLDHYLACCIFEPVGLTSTYFSSATTSRAGGCSLKYGLSVGIATHDACGESQLPVGGFGWYGIYSTWFWTLPRRRAAVLFFGNVLIPRCLPVPPGGRRR